MIDFLILSILLSLLVASIMIVFSEDLSHSVITYMGFGLGSTLLYFLFSAPDVALTEAVIGAGISSTVYLVALLQTSVHES